MFIMLIIRLIRICDLQLKQLSGMETRANNLHYIFYILTYKYR